MKEMDLYKNENESFEGYFERIHNILPNWPKEVLEEWLYRHNDQIDDYFFLQFDKFKFSLEKWNNKKIINEINSYKMEHIIDPLGLQILDKPSSFLQKYIYKNGTWPSPIIILKNKKSILVKNNEMLGNPHHLLEGHLRLGYIRNLYKNNRELNEEHLVYVVRKVEDK
ncbi:hypothetical protein [Cetobacterium sp. 2A]|uniref:hypothetical protein n=1 Tax=Cetobacterium sp. 2A TaxID=2754723 RepID=UPI00163D3511|nr:hypothetical protein [Cetobacterium sp. 2A]